MTTYAYKDGVLAVDSLITQSRRRLGDSEKIAVNDHGDMGAAAGDVAAIAKFLKWVRDRAADDFTLPFCDADFNAVLVTRDGRLFISGDEDMLLEIKSDHLAGGSGADIATGAMAAGASAVEAVQIAARYDNMTGGPIRAARLGEGSIRTVALG